MNCKTTTTLISLVLLLASQGHADWVKESQIPHCSEESRNRIADITRRQVETSVRRAESAIEPPSAIGDLSCLDGLMDMPLDWFAPTGKLNSLFQGSMDAVIGSGTNAKRICKFAEQKWRQVSRPITKPIDILRRGVPPSYSHSFDAAKGTNDDISSNSQDTQRENTSPKNSASKPQSVNRNNDLDSPVKQIWQSLYGKGETK